MATYITEDGNVYYENVPEEKRTLFPNLNTDPKDYETVKENLENLQISVAENYDATSTYAVGDYVLYDGLLYVCTTAISEAEEFNTEHWNEAQITTDIKNLKSKESSSTTVGEGWSVSSNVNYLVKKCGVITLDLWLTSGTLETGWTTVATIPEGFRPEFTFDTSIVDNNNGGAMMCKIEYGGAVKVYKSATAHNDFRIHVVYIEA